MCEAVVHIGPPFFISGGYPNAQDAINELLNCILRVVGQQNGGLMWTAASQTSRTLAGQVSVLRLPLARSQCPKDQRPDLGRLAPATKANGEARKRIPIERKQITVLFADLKGSMELLSERDPEEARKILDPVLDHMMGRV